MIFETKGGEEELSFSCRVQVEAATSKAANRAKADTGGSKKQGSKGEQGRRRV
jgi:hypothetical protein